MSSRKRKSGLEIPDRDDPAFVGLVFSSDADPGIHRQRSGTGFRYKAPDGSTVTDKRVRERINSLVIPPAWTDVWICANARGHLQVTGRDDRGRKQYRYHAKWRTHRDDSKFGRLAQFGETLPCIRDRVESDLHRHGLPQEKVIAAVIALLEQTAIRIGNDEYAKSNKSYGLTTLLDRHVDINTNSLRFKFKGKSGKAQAITLRDRRLAAVVKRCQDLPGQRLFVYEADDNHPIAITSSDVNDYLRELTGQDFTAKTFRTWAGTVSAVSVLRHLPVPESEAEAKREIIAATDATAELLGNTRSVARGSYIHPAVFQAWEEGTLQLLDPDHIPDVEPGGLNPDERVTLALLQR